MQLAVYCHGHSCCRRVPHTVFCSIPQLSSSVCCMWVGAGALWVRPVKDAESDEPLLPQPIRIQLSSNGTASTADVLAAFGYRWITPTSLTIGRSTFDLWTETVGPLTDLGDSEAGDGRTEDRALRAYMQGECDFCCKQSANRLQCACCAYVFLRLLCRCGQIA